MSKVYPPATGTYSPTQFITGQNITAHFGTTLTDLPTAEQQRYNDYATQANNSTEAIIYRYVDTIPLSISDEARTFAVHLALWYSLWLKATDDGAGNVASLLQAWEKFEERLITVLQSQPKQANTRRMVSNAFPDSVAPYSQSYGLSDIL